MKYKQSYFIKMLEITIIKIDMLNVTILMVINHMTLSLVHTLVVNHMIL